MKKLFGRDKLKQPKITSHRDVDAVIDDVRPKSLSFTFACIVYDPKNLIYR